MHQLVQLICSNPAEIDLAALSSWLSQKDKRFGYFCLVLPFCHMKEGNNIKEPETISSRGIGIDLTQCGSVLFQSKIFM